MFRDSKGRFIPEEERYKKATKVDRYVRGRWVRVIDQDKPILPKQLVNVINQDEFEALAPAFGKPTDYKPQTKRKYKAWDVAGQIANFPPRGVKGKMCRFEMTLKDGKRFRKIAFYRKYSKKTSMQIPIFYAMNNALRQEGLHFYNKVGHKLMADRVGKQVHLVDMTITPEL